MVWDPRQYLRYGGERLQPALDLLHRIDLEAPERIVDLGCGPGNVTRLLQERWPEARVLGLDSSPEMLKAARASIPEIDWRQGDIAAADFAPAPDLLYSNAALQHLDDHAGLFPRLASSLAPGGVLAVQMPLNHGMPSHTGMAAAAEAGPWAARLEPLLRRRPVAEPAFYYDLLRPLFARLQIWETIYLHVLEGEDPVVEWTKGTALKPLLDALDEGPRQAFLAEYRARMSEAYPRRSDGRTLFPFRRLFLLGTRA